jgi:glycosyltransferase involved in cell wall biosynthesis
MPMRWPQRSGSEYKRGFNEVARRNLMQEASTSDHILYIDADERISTQFKDALDPTADCNVTIITHFWNGRVRLQAVHDRAWGPGLQIRIFKRSSGLKFKSSDSNGLHTYLSRRGIKVPLGRVHGRIATILSSVTRWVLGIRVGGLSNPSQIYHYHYYDLTTKKRNDLRATEFLWPIESNVPETERISNNVVYTKDIIQGTEADLITKKYYDS